MFFLKKVTGIDIGSKTIKIVSAKNFKDKIYIDKAMIIDVPQQIEGVNNFREIFSLIGQVASESGISLKNVAILCPNNLYNSVNIILPDLKKKQDIKSAIKWELKSKYALNPEEINIDYFISDFTEDNKVEYQVYYAEKEKINEIMYEALKFKIHIKYIDIDYIAYSLCFNTLYPQDNNIKVLLDIGYQKTMIIFLLKDKVLFYRQLSSGLMTLFNLLTDEEIKIVKVKGLLDEEISKMLKDSVTEIIIEISKTIDYFVNGLKHPSPANIFCNGGFFAIPGVLSFFKENIPYPVMLNNVLDLVSYNGEYKSSGYLFHLAVGVTTL